MMLSFEKVSKSSPHTPGLWEAPGWGAPLLQLRRLSSQRSGHRIQTLVEHREEYSDDH
jgi:hypothetical protein